MREMGKQQAELNLASCREIERQKRRREAESQQNEKKSVTHVGKEKMLKPLTVTHMTGKECREKLYLRNRREPRMVPAFTYQALQQNTSVMPPKKINVFAKRPLKETLFQLYFKRGDIPAASTGGKTTNKLKKHYPVRWFCDPKEIDYCYYLPIFIDGLAERDVDMRALAKNGAMDLIVQAPHKILPVIPKLVLPFKRAFNTNHKKIIIDAFKVLQLMVTVGPCVGQALVPYYRQLLGVCNLYKNVNVNLGMGIDSDRDRRIGDVIEDTLVLLEKCGGPNAFINIKYMIPTYESRVYPKCETIAEMQAAQEFAQRQQQQQQAA